VLIYQLFYNLVNNSQAPGCVESRPPPDFVFIEFYSYFVLDKEYDNPHSHSIILSMIVTIVHVWVKPEFIEAFIAATKLNHLHSVKETGNFRFDILQDAADPSKFVLYEAYESEKAAAAHKETSHYLTWRDTVAPWMAKSREGIKHEMLMPERA
jgi:(4S)-4-hydroxy-5-phosphonooxypentane-2,3-dione isomerase